MCLTLMILSDFNNKVAVPTTINKTMTAGNKRFKTTYPKAFQFNDTCVIILFE